MPQSPYRKIEEALTRDELDIMDQWATNTSLSIRSSKVTLDATFIVLSKLWERFNPDEVDAWCDSLVSAKMSTSQSK